MVLPRQAEAQIPDQNWTWRPGEGGTRPNVGLGGESPGRKPVGSPARVLVRKGWVEASPRVR